MNVITVTEYDRVYRHTYGLGQDVAHDLKNLAKVASLFVFDSKINTWLLNERLDEVVTDVVTCAQLKFAIRQKEIILTHRQLGGTRTKSEANSLVQAIFEGQGRRLAFVDWAAQNYVSVTVAFGLIKFNQLNDSYQITDLGRQAVKMYDAEQNEELDTFFYERLLEYPYAAWLLRLTARDTEKKFSKFDLGSNFGFIDELGFSTAPLNLYLDGLAEATINHDSQLRSQIRSNFESTGDKYMRWLAGVLVNYGLLKSEQNTRVSHCFEGRVLELSIGITYQISYKGLQALRRVNGFSSYARTKKRVMWEYLAPKAGDAIRKKTVRALILKVLSEGNSRKEIVDISDKINKEYPSLEVTPEQILDDCKGINRIGIEIEIEGTQARLKDQLLPFEIPIQRQSSFVKQDIDILKDKLRKDLKLLNHSYLKGIDIALKSRTSNTENTEFESLSVDLFTKECLLEGKHLGGSNRPDGIAWCDEFAFIIDSKAYSDGFPLTRSNTDPMLRYLNDLNSRNPEILPNWWIDIPENITNKYFVYISGKFRGEYIRLLDEFKTTSNHSGGALEYIKLLLLAENYKSGRLNTESLKNYILDTNIDFEDYYSKLTS